MIIHIVDTKYLDIYVELKKKRKQCSNYIFGLIIEDHMELLNELINCIESMSSYRWLLGARIINNVKYFDVKIATIKQKLNKKKIDIEHQQNAATINEKLNLKAEQHKWEKFNAEQQKNNMKLLNTKYNANYKLMNNRTKLKTRRKSHKVSYPPDHQKDYILCLCQVCATRSGRLQERARKQSQKKLLPNYFATKNKNPVQEKNAKKQAAQIHFYQLKYDYWCEVPFNASGEKQFTIPTNIGIYFGFMLKLGMILFLYIKQTYFVLI